MRIGIQTWGSHGDIRPFVAFAEGLQAAGHAVHLVITCVDSQAYDNYVSEHGVRVSIVASPVLSPAQQEETAQLAYRIRHPMKQMAAVLKACFAPVEDAMFAAAQRLCAESDLVIGHYFLHPLQISAERAGVPYVSVLLSHAGIPSAFNHPLGKVGLGRPVNRMLWALLRRLLNGVLLHYPNRLRAQLGMALVRDIVTEVWLSPHLTLVAVSPRICRAQPDWPAALHVSGFLDRPGLAIEGTLTGPLAAFLDAGPAPVYMTFGSWMPKDGAAQQRTLGLLTEAARLAGCRAIIQGDSPAGHGFVSNDRILYIAAAPHAAVFPRCSAIVHHGGAGTTHAAARAGKPQVIVANISEQEHWAGELRHLGVAGPLARRRELTAAGLAKRMRAVLDAPGMAARAQALAAEMQEEDGVRDAVRLITECFAPADAPSAPASRAGSAQPPLMPA